MKMQTELSDNRREDIGQQRIRDSHGLLSVSICCGCPLMDDRVSLDLEISQFLPQRLLDASSTYNSKIRARVARKDSYKGLHQLFVPCRAKKLHKQLSR